MQVIYRHGFNNNLMIIRDNNILVNDYRINMVIRNKISGLLEMYIGCVNGESELTYVISSKQSIKDLFARNKMNYEDLMLLMNGIISISKELREYLLDINKILLDLDYIYYDINDKCIYFCYYPNNEVTFEKAFRDVLQDIVLLVEHNDYKAVEMAYGIMEICNNVNFTLKHIEEYINDVSEDNNVTKIEKSFNNTKSEDNSYCNAYKNNIYNVIDKKENHKNEKFNYLNERIEDEDTLKSIVGEESYYNISEKQNENNSLFGKVTKFMISRGFKESKTEKKNRKIKYREMKDNRIIYDEDYGLLKEGEGSYIKEDREESGKEKYKKNYLYDEDAFRTINQNIKDISGSDYEDNGIDESETILLSDIIKDKKRKLFSLCDYDDILINEYPFTIGKANGKVDEIIEDKLVSRIHLRINNESDKFTIEDLNSKNGTYVNGERLNPYEKVEITVGDKITIASSDYIFK